MRCLRCDSKHGPRPPHQEVQRRTPATTVAMLGLGPRYEDLTGSTRQRLGTPRLRGLGCLLCVCQGHDKNSWSHQLNGAEQMMMIRFQRPSFSPKLRETAAAHVGSRTLPPSPTDTCL